MVDAMPEGGTWGIVVGVVGLALTGAAALIRTGKLVAKIEAVDARIVELADKIDHLTRLGGIFGTTQASLTAEIEALRRDIDRHERHFSTEHP